MRRKPATGLCPEAVVLLERYSELVTESLDLQEANFQAVVAADVDVSRIQRLLSEVNKQKDNYKTAYIEHVRSHRCSVDWPLVDTPAESKETRKPATSQPRDVG